MKNFKLTFIEKGIASNRIYHVYDRFTQDCFLHKPDYIVMLIGVNDAWQIHKPDDYPIDKCPEVVRESEPCYREILRRIRDEMPKTKLITLLPFLIDTISEKRSFKQELDKMRDMQIRLLKEFGFNVVIDLQEVFDEASKIYNPNKLSTDGIHPTKLGHSVIAQSVANVLKDMD